MSMTIYEQVPINDRGDRISVLRKRGRMCFKLMWADGEPIETLTIDESALGNLIKHTLFFNASAIDSESLDDIAELVTAEQARRENCNKM